MKMAKITRLDDEVAVVLPRDLARRYGLEPGNDIYLRERNLGLELSAQSPEDRVALRDAERSMAQYKRVNRGR